MKEELIELATSKDINFRSKFFTSKSWLHSYKENTRYYLWICELHQWLEEEYSIFLSTYFEHGAWVWRINASGFEAWSGGVDSRPEALEEGLVEVLQLIIDKQFKRD